MSGYAHPEALVSTAWLAERPADPAVAVVEVGADSTAYDKGHLPGAVSLSWERELHAVPRRDFVPGDRLAWLLGIKGVGTGRTIVLYGGDHNRYAAAAYWLFAYRGIDDVRLLDGGRARWELESRPVTRDVPTPRWCHLRRGPDRPELRALRDDVVRTVADGGQLVDVRSPAEFAGLRTAPEPRAHRPGHVPGATNVPWSATVHADGTFRRADELRALYAGLLPDEPVTTYCRTGERSAHTWFALTRLLGFRDVRNYDGSWSEYGSLVGVPVARGA